MHNSDGFGFADAGPLVEPVAAEKARLAPHLPQIQAAEQGCAGRGGAVEGDHGFKALLGPS